MIGKNKDADSDKPFKPLQAVLWVGGGLVGGLLFFFVGRVLDQRQELEKSWKAGDRVPIVALEGILASTPTNNPAMLGPLFEAEQAFVAQFGKETPDGAAGLNRLANSCVLRGDYATAESTYREVRDILTKHLGPGHPDIVLVEKNLETLQTLRTNTAFRAGILSTNTPMAVGSPASSAPATP